MRPIDQILERTGAATRQSLRVPEWDLEVWWAPVTMHDQRQLGLQQLTDELDLAVHLVIRKAEDAEGERLFTLADAHALGTQADAAPIARLAAAMCADLTALGRAGFTEAQPPTPEPEPPTPEPDPPPPSSLGA